MKKVLLSLLVIFAVALTLSSCTCQHNNPSEIVILEAKDPTCQKEGLTEGMKCNLCGVSVVPQVAIPKLECTPGEWIVDKEATKTEDGARHTNCTVCGERVDEILYATGSVGLTYRIRSDGKTCAITGTGTCTDSELIIPAYIDGYPVSLFEIAVCHGITSIYVNEKNEYFKSIDGNLYTKDGKTLVKYPTDKENRSFDVPSFVTTISNYAFSGNQFIARINIPDSVINIGANVFSSCISLTNITIPDSVTSIGNGAFFRCASLTNITIPESVTSIGNVAFYDCTSLTNITIPDSVTSIESYAFWNCSSLMSIHFYGTAKQWGAIGKGYQLDGGTGDYTVCCTDGEIAKDGTITYYADSQ